MGDLFDEGRWGEESGETAPRCCLPGEEAEAVRRRVLREGMTGVSGSSESADEASAPSSTSSLAIVPVLPGVREMEAPWGAARVMVWPIGCALGVTPLGALRQAWMRFLPSGWVTSGWSLAVVNV